MLVTDGVPYNYKEIFERYNWKYDTPVRVFTYLIGREVKVVPLQVLLCVYSLCNLHNALSPAVRPECGTLLCLKDI